MKTYNYLSQIKILQASVLEGFLFTINYLKIYRYIGLGASGVTDGPGPGSTEGPGLADGNGVTDGAGPGGPGSTEGAGVTDGIGVGEGVACFSP